MDTQKWEAVRTEELKKINARRGLDEPVNDDLVGMALSGGGIRSATFALGVLEELKECNLLKRIDYLSSVSGGGYIASWLSANCKRSALRKAASNKNPPDSTEYAAYERASRDWLDPSACWKDSIAHLRRYSNYLAPKVGVLSADTWTMGTVWVRNTLLIQCILILGFAVVLLTPRFFLAIFAISEGYIPVCIDALLFFFIILQISCNQLHLNRDHQNEKVPQKFWSLSGYTQGRIQRRIVIPGMILAYSLSTEFWRQNVSEFHAVKSSEPVSFMDFFLNVHHAWWTWILCALIAFSFLAYKSIRRVCDRQDFVCIAVATGAATAIFYVLMCFIAAQFQIWKGNAANGLTVAFIWGPPMVLYAFSLSVVMLIGITGRQSTDGVREWWSRLGAWLGIYGFIWILITLTTCYGPKWGALVLSNEMWNKPAILAWLMPTLAGLLAGKSGATGGTGNEARNQKISVASFLDVIAKVGPLVFVAGLMIAISMLLHLILLKLTSNSWNGLWDLSHQHWYFFKSMEESQWAWVGEITAICLVVLFVLVVLANFIDINEFSLNAFYRWRLSRCYLGATRFLVGERSPQRFTGFDEKDNMPFADLGTGNSPAGPLHIVNCALNLGGSSDLMLHTRHSASFTFTPYTAGSSYPSRDEFGNKKPMGYCSISSTGGKRGTPTIAQVMSVSGAAASPNMGYHTSPLVAFLLTVFNVRLGLWLPNPANSAHHIASPRFALEYLLKELFGSADEKSDYLMLSDGGHFENLGVYELIRRQCRVIIISDAECDPDLKFESLGALIRMCDVDLDTTIKINVDSIRQDSASGWSNARYAVGEIIYRESSLHGVLIYLKAAMSGKEDAAVRQYKDCHPAFPHESTGNQFYGEDQFESYRRLGKDIAHSVFQQVNCNQAMIDIADALWRLPDEQSAPREDNFALRQANVREMFRGKPRKRSAAKKFK